MAPPTPLAAFQQAYARSLPHTIPRRHILPPATLPHWGPPAAALRWFDRGTLGFYADTIHAQRLDDAYLSEFGDTMVAMERVVPAAGDSGIVKFEAFEAPLGAFLNNLVEEQPVQLYIAQQPIDGLPAPLAADLKTPPILEMVGKGDLYGSSLWMGNGPETFSPLHKDPNPNLFFQLAGFKDIRLLPPEEGRALYENVRRKVAAQGGSPGGGSASIRGVEMMQGGEREMLKDAVWGEDVGGDDELVRALKKRQTRVRIGPMDALFIPNGWWHSVRGLTTPDTVIASANWWFR